jgi:hypothetical protein
MSGDLDFVLGKKSDASRILRDHPDVLARWPGKTWHWLSEPYLAFLYEILEGRSEPKRARTHVEFLEEFKTLATKESDAIDEEASAMVGTEVKHREAYLFQFPDPLADLIAGLDDKEMVAVAMEWEPKLSGLSGTAQEILRDLSKLCRDARKKKLSIFVVDNCMY